MCNAEIVIRREIVLNRKKITSLPPFVIILLEVFLLLTCDYVETVVMIQNL